MILVTLSFPEAKVKIWQKFQISLCKKLNNKYFNYYVKVQVERFYLNDSIVGFYPRIQKLQPLYGTALFTLGIKELRGRSFDFWGGYGWFQKKISCRLISRGKKILARKYLAKKNPTLTKNLSWRIMLEKKSYIVVFQEKKGQKILTQTKSLIPPPPLQKSQM